MDRGSALEEALRRLGMIAEGVKTCVIVNDDGFAVAAYPVENQENSGDDPPNSAQVAAVSAMLASLAERSLDRLAQGDMGRMLLEGESGTLLSCPAGI